MSRSRIIGISCIALLAGCEVGPDYRPPEVNVPAAYKEAPAPQAPTQPQTDAKTSSTWIPAKPMDGIDRGAWWSIYDDPVLDGYEKQIDISNQNLKASEASYRQARAIVEEARSQLFPFVTLDAGANRAGGGASVGGAKTAYTASVGATWDIDVWGRIRRTIEGDIASAQASAADIASARLSAQAELAGDYFSLRAQDELIGLLNATVDADTKALQIVQNQYDQGVAAKADVLAAQTQMQSVQAQAINAGVARAQLEHAIAALIGKPPSELSVAVAPFAKDIPQVPAGIPSALLERRPDIASAERQMASANAQIGVATAAWFPDISLNASYGYAAAALGHLIGASTSLWSFGPQLAETIFDAGLREAQVEEARAFYDQTVALYRQTVLTGFQQVEDNLAALRILEDQAKVENDVVASAQKAEELTLNQYKEGIVPYSSVLLAQTATLANEQTALAVRENRFAASVGLIEALGGGWDVSQLAGNCLPDVPAEKPTADSAKSAE